MRATFDLPGKYVTHCHILSHEEHDMMRFMQVGPDAYPAPGVVVAAEPVAPATSVVTAFSNQPIVAAFKDNETASIVDRVLI